MLLFVIAAAGAVESRCDDCDEVSLLQLRGTQRAGESDAVQPWPQLGPNHRKCADSTGHRIDPEVSDCGTRMIDIDISGKEVDGEYYMKKGRGVTYDGPSNLNLRYKNVTKFD